MRFIDLSTWDRAMHYQAFKNSVQPQYCVTFDLDITNFLPKINAKGYSFTFAFVYAVTKCANQIEAFRCRFVDGKPAILDTVNTSFTYLKKGTELFKVVNVPMQDSMEEYVALAKKLKKIKQRILQALWETTFISFRLSRGYRTVIYPIRTPVTKTMLHHYLIGGSFTKRTEKYFCHSPFKSTTHLWTEYTSGN